MPELPEVTTIATDIEKNLIGRTISAVKLTSLGENLRIKAHQDLDQLLTGKKIEGAQRRAKYLIIKLSNDDQLVIHLKLTGQLLLREKGSKPDEFTRLVLNLDNGAQLRFCDRNGAAEAFIVTDFTPIEDKLGPEPFLISVEQLKTSFLNTEKKTVKEALVDQKIIAGVGNIYVDEALFLAKMNPFTSPKSITTEVASVLIDAVRQVLNEGIEHRGTTIDSYRDLFGNPGGHQKYLRVYGKERKPCPTCNEPIQYTEIGGRRTFYCLFCQPEAQLSLF